MDSKEEEPPIEISPGVQYYGVYYPNDAIDGILRQIPSLNRILNKYSERPAYYHTTDVAPLVVQSGEPVEVIQRAKSSIGQYVPGHIIGWHKTNDTLCLRITVDGYDVDHISLRKNPKTGCD